MALDNSNKDEFQIGDKYYIVGQGTDEKTAIRDADNKLFKLEQALESKLQFLQEEYDLALFKGEKPLVGTDVTYARAYQKLAAFGEQIKGSQYEFRVSLSREYQLTDAQKELLKKKKTPPSAGEFDDCESLGEHLI